VQTRDVGPVHRGDIHDGELDRAAEGDRDRVVGTGPRQRDLGAEVAGRRPVSADRTDPDAHPLHPTFQRRPFGEPKEEDRVPAEPHEPAERREPQGGRGAAIRAKRAEEVKKVSGAAGHGHEERTHANVVAYRSFRETRERRQVRGVLRISVRFFARERFLGFPISEY